MGLCNVTQSQVLGAAGGDLHRTAGLCCCASAVLRGRAIPADLHVRSASGWRQGQMSPDQAAEDCVSGENHV